MSRNEWMNVSCPTFLSIPPDHTQTGGEVQWGIARMEESEGKVGERGKGIKEDWSVGKKVVWKLQKWRREERYWTNLFDLGQFRTLTDLVSLSSNYFDIILSNSWKSRRCFLLCYPMMSFSSFQGTKSPSALSPNPQPRPDHLRPLLKHSWTHARFLIFRDMQGVNLPDLVLCHPDHTDAF